MTVKPSTRRRWLLLAIVLLAFGLRLYRLDFQSLRGDEAASATYAQLEPAEILEISRVADPHPPLFYLVLHGWERLVGPSAFSVRFWVVIAGVLAIPAIYALASRLLNQRAALVAAFLLAINSFHIWHSQDVRSYTWFMLLGLGSAILLWQGLTRRRWRDWGAYAIVMTILFYVHYYALFLVMGHALIVLGWIWTQRSKWLALIYQWGAMVLLAGLAFLPWLRVSWQFVTRFTGDFDPALPHVVLWRGLQAFSGGLAAEVPQFSPWMLPFVLLAGWGWLILWRRKPRVAIFLTCYFALPILGIMVLTLRGQAFTERYLIAALPAYLILVAAGLIWLWQQRATWSRAAVIAGLVLAIGLNGSVLINYQFDLVLAKSPEWRQLFDHIENEQNPATDLLIYNFPEASVTYYLDTRHADRVANSQMPVFLVPPEPNPEADWLAGWLTNLLADYQRVWFVPVSADGWDDGKRVEIWLNRHADLIQEADFHWIETNLYLTPAAIERTMRPQAVPFAQGITLRGFQLFNTITKGESKQVYLNEQILDLSLYWAAFAPTDRPLTVFTQFIDSTGQFRGGQDNQPVWGTYPTTAWQASEQVVDQFAVTLQPDAPPGPYQIWIGLYDAETGERIPVLDADGNPIADHGVLDITVWIE